MLAGALAISVPGNARAIGKKILHKVETLLVGTQMNVRTGYRHNDPDRLPPPPDEGFSELPNHQWDIKFSYKYTVYDPTRIESMK